MTLTKEQSAAHKGAKWLDKKKPDWFRFEFDWEKFNIYQGGGCVVGQMYAPHRYPGQNGYQTGMQALGKNPTDHAFAEEHGFMAATFTQSERYRDAWKFEVELRRADAYRTAPETPAEKLLTDEETALILYLLEGHERRTHELSLQATDDRHIGYMDAEIKLTASIKAKL